MYSIKNYVLVVIFLLGSSLRPDTLPRVTGLSLIGD
jgi:hypothetical protein